MRLSGNSVAPAYAELAAQAVRTAKRPTRTEMCDELPPSHSNPCVDDWELEYQLIFCWALNIAVTQQARLALVPERVTMSHCTAKVERQLWARTPTDLRFRRGTAYVKGFGCRPVVEARSRAEGRRPKASEEGTRGKARLLDRLALHTPLMRLAPLRTIRAGSSYV